MRESQLTKAFPSPEHDHGPCLEQTLDRATSAFQSKGLRFTPLRRRIFEEIAGSHHAIGAYEILERLAQRGGARLAPISVYRTLDVLLEAGVIHRLESRSAFFACHAPHAADRRQIVLACDRCGIVAEVAGDVAFDAIAAAARKAGFVPSHPMVEVAGTCRRCSTAADA